MRVTTHAPCARLAPFVRHFTTVETDGAAAARTLLPETGLVLGLRYRGAARQDDAATPLPDATLAGMRDRARRMATAAGSGIVLAVFRAGAAAAFFAEPMHELFGDVAPLDALIAPAELRRVATQVGEAGDVRQRIAAVEDFLLARRREDRDDPLVAAALARIRASRGALRVGALAGELGLSRDRLEKRFRRVVGATPKQLAKLVRARRAIELVRGGASLASAALDAGYFDQSHFIRELRPITGEAPRRFFQSVEHC